MQKFSRRNEIFVVVTVLLAAFLPCKAAGESPSDKDDNQPIEVFAFELKQQELYDPVVFGGFVESESSRRLAPEVAGTINKFFVKLGDQVVKGQLLFDIAPFTSGLQFQPHRVFSPITGMVSGLLLKEGQQIKQGESVLEIADPKKLQVKIDAAYNDLNYLKPKIEVEVTRRASETQTYKTMGSIESISPAADQTTGTFPIIVKLTCKEFPQSRCSDVFKLGTFVQVIHKHNVRHGFKLPLAVLQRNQSQVITIDEAGKAKWQGVKIGKNYGSEVEILEGVKEGMKIITSAAKQPKDGSQVIIKSMTDYSDLLQNYSRAPSKDKGH